MPRYRITRTFSWCAAHRLIKSVDPRSSTIHGHQYSADLVVGASWRSDKDWIVDINSLDCSVKDWIRTHWDHTSLCNYEDTSFKGMLISDQHIGKKAGFFFDEEPSVQNVAKRLFEESEEMVQGIPAVTIEEVTVHVTPECSSTWRPRG